MSAPFYFKHIDIPYDQTEVSNFFNSRPKNKESFEMLKAPYVLAMVPSISNWFSSQNLFPEMVAYIAVGGNSNQKIHTDGGKAVLAINFPVYNCDSVKTYFYEVDNSTVINPTNRPDNGYEVTLYENIKTVACSYILNKPYLINIKIPHNISNHTDNSRYCLSFRFYQDPVHLIN